MSDKNDANIQQAPFEDKTSAVSAEVEKLSYEKASNPHEKHRLRMKDRYQKNGFKGFSPHEILEFILFYSIPYKDTNALAHDLVARYGSFANILEADLYDLKKTKGVGEHTALFLSMLPELFQYYRLDKRKENELLDTTEALGAYGTDLFIGHSRETFYVLCLNSKNYLLQAAMIDEGTSSEVNIYISHVVEVVLRYKAKKVVLMHNHPSGNPHPSKADMDLTNNLRAALEGIGISVIDHLIICGEKYTSFAEKGLLPR